MDEGVAVRQLNGIFSSIPNGSDKAVKNFTSLLPIGFLILNVNRVQYFFACLKIH
ncbi:MAG: hypothetical protein ACJATV_001263 [Granulosicoccus sp.]|jgi:hypothetical protein